ncbi:MAG: beta-ketoacyl-[acyl-carrier-protein] synthase family protein [Proteobacteria bacterium]|nr:beta-ketoacyl-[acyl-carrier-protein] synthase family protein [Pseudomonadota bacterium]
MAAPREVVITGIGVVSPIGIGVPQLLAHLRENRSGIRLWEAPEFGMRLPAGRIEQDFSGEFTKLELPYLDRCSQIAVLAAKQASDDAGIPNYQAYGLRAGMYFGSVGGGVRVEHNWVEEFHVAGKRAAKPFTIMACMLNSAASQISIRQQILGPVMTHSSACSSSGAAIGDAYRAIRDGYLDVAVAGGAEACLIPTFTALWTSLRALAEPHLLDVGRSCCPFDKKRSGLVLAEGAVFFVLEASECAGDRSADIYARLSGYGIASDGYHIGSPKAEGQIATMRAALDDASLGPSDVGYVNAHATGTPGGDVVEARAIKAVFGSVPVSSTKGIHGHLLGAASALELAIATLAVNRSFLPATAHLEEVDPACDLNHVARIPVQNYPIRHAMSLSAGFGGTNVALVVSEDSELPTKSGFDAH